MPLSPAGLLVALARKKEIKRSRERQSTYLWSGSRVSCCWFSSIQPKPNQTKPNLFTMISLLVWLRLRVILVTGTIGLVTCILVCVCLSAHALRFISFRSFMHVLCSGGRTSVRETEIAVGDQRKTDGCILYGAEYF